MAGHGENAPAPKRPALAMAPTDETKPSAEPSAARPRSGPSFKSSPQRTAALMAQAGDRGPVVMGMVTPPRGSKDAATPPDIDGVPAPGCSVDELRAYVLKAMGNVGKDVTTLEVRAAERINQVEAGANNLVPRVNELERKMGILEPMFAKIGTMEDRLGEVEKSLGALEPLRKDLSVYTTIKSFITQGDLDARMAEIDERMKTLTDQSNQFVTHLDQHFTKLNELEKDFKGHVEKNFMAVEHECNRIKRVIEGIHDGTTRNVEGNITAAQIKIGQIGEELAQFKGMVEGNITAAQIKVGQIGEGLAQFKGMAEAESVGTRQEILELKNEVGRAMANLALLKDSVDRHDAASSSAPKPENLEHLARRVEVLEARDLQRSQGTPDPWHEATHGPQGSQGPPPPRPAFLRQPPLRNPPGFQREPPAPTGTLPSAARRPQVVNEVFPT